MAGQLERFLSIYGVLFDGIKTTLEGVLDGYDPEVVDADWLPYIDSLTNWPTDRRLTVDQRRIETANAVAIWKEKGKYGSIRSLIENISGWDVEIFSGWRYVLFSNDEVGTPDTSSVIVPDIGTHADTLRYTNTLLDWHGLNGVLIILTPVDSTESALIRAYVSKIFEMVSRLLPVWANTQILVTTPLFEENLLALIDEDRGFSIADPNEDMLALEDDTEATFVGSSVFLTNNAARLTNKSQVLTPHGSLILGA